MKDAAPKKSGSKSFKILTLLQLCTVVAVVAVGWFYIRPERSFSAPKRGVIDGILFSPDNPSTLIDGQVLRTGDSLYGVEVVAIDRRMVTFQCRGRRWEQRVKERPNKAWKESDSDAESAIVDAPAVSPQGRPAPKRADP